MRPPRARTRERRPPYAGTRAPRIRHYPEPTSLIFLAAPPTWQASGTRAWQRRTTRPRAAASASTACPHTRAPSIACSHACAAHPPLPLSSLSFPLFFSDTSLIYFHHANDYWTSIDDTFCRLPNGKNTSIVDLWGEGAPAYGLNNSWDCSQTNQAAGCKYEDELFVEEVLARIAAHDVSTPFFLFWAPHIAHAPLEVPQAYIDKFAFIEDKNRRLYAAMVNYVDGLVGRVVAALKAKGMWDNLLWVSSADNGGPIYNSGAAGANNFPCVCLPRAAGRRGACAAPLTPNPMPRAPSPLPSNRMRGGKMSNWQGGIRVNAYAAGGLLPAAVAGTKSEGLWAGADIYSTFCALAGVDPTDERAAAAGLPPVDGVNQWPFLSGATTTSPRAEVPIGSDATEANLLQLSNATVVQGLVRADGWKLLIGETGQNIWTGPQYPNKSTSWNDVPYHCGVPSSPPDGKGGCLFNILTDPTEHDDVAADHPDIVAEMYARLLELQATAFGPNRGKDDGTACKNALQTWKGFWGPFLE